MRIGANYDNGQPFDAVVRQVAAMAERGIGSAWSSQVFGPDTLTVLAAVSREVPGIEFGTAVIPTYPRHPVMLAAQALTVQEISGGRLTLGIGLSHQMVIENMYGLSFDKPARHMREYLEVLVPLLAGEQVTFAGETLRVSTFGPLEVHAPAPDVLVAALGTVMLHIAARQASGTITWMTGPVTVEEHIVPTIRTAAAEAGRALPRVAVGLPVCVTDDAAAARAKAAEEFSVYGFLPSYRAMLDREGVEGPADVAIVGTAAEVAARIRRLADVGATDFCGAPFGSRNEIMATLDTLGGLAGS
jgi:F420-dependent oxidoreductase-like protein